MNRQMLSGRLKRRIMRNTGRLINRLVDNQVLKGILAEFTEHEITDICGLVPEQFMVDPPVLELTTETPLMIVGDVYGQYGHLVRLFNYYGHPPRQRYLFLGNFVSANSRAIETVALLFAYKLRYPKSIYLLRGKHECGRVAKFYGFYDECLKRFTQRLWNAITDVFNYMPVVAIIDNRIMCVHSGLSPLFQQMDVRGLNNLKLFIKKSITLPAELEANRLLMHFVWSEPDESLDFWDQNPAGQGYLYGIKAVKDFCERFELQQIIRSSEMVKTGFEFFPCAKLLTIFSAPDYMEFYSNTAVFVYLENLLQEKDRRCRLRLAHPIIRLRCKQTLRMNMTFDDLPIELGVGIGQVLDLEPSSLYTQTNSSQYFQKCSQLPIDENEHCQQSS
ncbi:Serine/threonine-protein phosphatase [Fasciola gigantica]|uniref:Serine/threonine-protein phosphatase n=1 Tax=Fasciola gigantica TaxID=46835 RepID=A0A504YLY3_FASGI|nr:Serine/threonine-protein phosphatase [Fasciola gigantica]